MAAPRLPPDQNDQHSPGPQFNPYAAPYGQFAPVWGREYPAYPKASAWFGPQWGAGQPRPLQPQPGAPGGPVEDNSGDESGSDDKNSTEMTPEEKRQFKELFR
jgi:hypothetical protein